MSAPATGKPVGGHRYACAHEKYFSSSFQIISYTNVLVRHVFSGEEQSNVLS
jgi:hypothetical protein